ncbi:MAG: hypothetical protein JW809_15190 [Pirellulales bacterium]|nr:hypothetical protein [Pirellulales bacterium]
MAHELAKLMLEQTSTFLDRAEAIRTAVFLGMPLQEIEEYLDWTEMAKPPADEAAKRPAMQP